MKRAKRLERILVLMLSIVILWVTLQGTFEQNKIELQMQKKAVSMCSSETFVCDGIHVFVESLRSVRSEINTSLTNKKTNVLSKSGKHQIQNQINFFFAILIKMVGIPIFIYMLIMAGLRYQVYLHLLIADFIQKKDGQKEIVFS